MCGLKSRFSSRIRLALVSILYVALLDVAWALPDAFVQEGYVTNRQGQPETGPRLVRIRLYDRAVGGQPLFEEIHRNVDFVSGYYAVTIGSVENLDGDIFQQDEIFLGIRIADGDELVPRTAIVRVPAAFSAVTAINVTGDINPKTVSVNGRRVINEDGEWVGPPTGLQGPVGPEGPAGQQGVQGNDGEDGRRSLINLIAEAAGNNCPTGGIRLEVGVDNNGNGRLEAGEVADERYVCNGSDGAAGDDGQQGQQGSADTPEQILNKLIQVDGAASGLNADRLDGLDSTAFVRPADIENVVRNGNQVLQLLLEVDGPGSGLDADRLDGIDSSEFVRLNDVGAAQVLAMIKTVDGSGSGLDADRLDGLDSTQFVTDAAQVLALLKTVDGSGTGVDADLLDGIDSSEFIRTAEDLMARLRDNDGAGSGLDADRLDGKDSTEFVTSAQQVLALLKEVDGEGSGVDADRLDGKDSSEFVSSAAQVLDMLKTVDGQGSGVDADRIDGLDSGVFMRADQDTGTVGNVNIQGKLDVKKALTAAGDTTVGNDLVVENKAQTGELTVAAAGIPAGTITARVHGVLKADGLLMDSLELTPQAEPPADPVIGTVYNDDQDGLKVYDGNEWLPLGSQVATDEDMPCDEAHAGTIRFVNGVFEGCDGEGWDSLGGVSSPGGGGDGTSRKKAGRHCAALRAAGVEQSGLYWINPNGGDTDDAFQTYCDMVTDGGGWTLVARTRRIGLTDDQRRNLWRGTWHDYTQGGLDSDHSNPDPNSALYWMPLKHWHELTLGSKVTFWSKTSANSVRVRDFNVADLNGAYAWSWSGPVAGHQEIVSGLNGAKFTTHDQDNDTWGSNCAKDNVGFLGGFWYTNCYQLSMLHSNGNIYALYNNIDTKVDYNEIYLRPKVEPAKPETIRKTCREILENDESTGTGLYWIDPNGGNADDAFMTRCDMASDGGGWTLLGHSIKGAMGQTDRDSIRKGSWHDYTQGGFGDPADDSGAFWVPLQKWHELTKAYPENVFWSNTNASALKVRNFSIAGAGAKYAWSWGGGVAGHESLIGAMNGARFTTFDNDNDTWGSNCAKDNVGFLGGFWYTNCYQLSMLHSDNHIYALYNNINTSVAYNELWFREKKPVQKPETIRKHCLEILENDESVGSGVYWIDPTGGNDDDAMLTQCDMVSDGGGWTMLAKTIKDALTDTDKWLIWKGDWNDYTQAGYGSPEPESGVFWLPLKHWHTLTKDNPSNVWWSDTSNTDVKMRDFSIGSPGQNYAWSWSGNLPGTKSLIAEMRGAQFTTHDNDNDTWGSNCAKDNVSWLGGFWYTNCYQLSMLHSNANIYALFNNVSTSVSHNTIWFRPKKLKPKPDEIPANCYEIKKANDDANSGLYWVDPNGGSDEDAMLTKCDMVSDGGGWTMLAKTISGLGAAEKNLIWRGTWDDYTREGFGSAEDESSVYWAPLEQWHALTRDNPKNLFWSQTSGRSDVRMRDFSVGGSGVDYRWSWFGGVPGFNSLIAAMKDARFTTWDNDNDTWGSNCAKDNVGFLGGFWYTNCYQLSMLHSNGSIYALFSNISHSTNDHQIWFRPKEQLQQPDTIRKSCKGILDAGESDGDGVYWIDPNEGDRGDAVLTFCDMRTDGGGWTLVAKTDGNRLTDGDRNAIWRGTWDEYTRSGFGEPSEDAAVYWMPLVQWKALTDNGHNTFWSQYNNRTDVRMTGFEIGGANEAFKWSWTGTADGYNSLIAAMNNARFTTWDNDNDTWGSNCAKDNVGFLGGFWYTNCYQLSMLHSNGSIYALFSNTSHSVTTHHIWLR